MKKSLLALGASVVALSGMAGVPAPKETSPYLFGGAHTLESASATQRHEFKSTLERPESGVKKAPAKINPADDIIREVEGRRQNTTTTCSGYYLYVGYNIQMYYNGQSASHIVYGENDEVYIYDLVPYASKEYMTDNYGLDSYVKGYIKDGNKIEIPLPQTVFYNEDWNDGYNLSMMKWEHVKLDDGQEGDTWMVDPSVTSITFNLREDGSFGLDEDLPVDQLLGLSWTSDDWWAEMGVWAYNAVPFYEEVETVPSTGFNDMPANYWTLTREWWPVPFTEVKKDYYASPVSKWYMGMDTDYFQGVFDCMPEALIKVEKPDFFTYKIPSGQYLGQYKNAYTWLRFALITIDEEYGNPRKVELLPLDYEYEMTWDPTSSPESLTPKDKNVWMIINADPVNPRLVEYFTDIKFQHTTNFAGTPMKPYGMGLQTMTDVVGYDMVQVHLPNISTDGTPLKDEDLYYEMYLDGELWDFEPDQYPGLTSSINLVPWDLTTEGANIWHGIGTVHCINLFVEGYTTIGFRSVYKYDGVTTYSELYEEEPKGYRPGGANDDQSVGSVIDGKQVTDVKYFDLSGREVANPANGVFVKKVTFEDGTVNTVKSVVK